MKVYKAICAVTEEMSERGISKGRKNQQQGYSFRGIDDVLNTLSPMLAKHMLCILPRVVAHDCVERTTAKGGAIFYTTMRIEFDLVSAEDGSKHTVSVVGEAMDSADKSSNKAQSAAYKYLALLVFCIPTEASPDTDADFSTHEVAAKPAAPAQASASQDMRPQARARRIAVGVAAGDAKGAALALSQMDEKTLAEIWEHIDVESQSKLTAAWPVTA